MHMDDRQLARVYKISLAGGEYALPPGILETRIFLDISQSAAVQSLFNQEYRQLERDRNTLRNDIFSGTKDNDYPLPVNVMRVIQNAQITFKLYKRTPSNLHPKTIVDGVTGLCERMVVVRGIDALSVEAQKNATLLFQIHIRSTLAIRRVLEEFRFVFF